MEKYISFFLRLICLPFWACLVLIGCLYKFFYTCVMYVINGGEIAAYMRRDDKKMMNDVYQYAKKKLDDEKGA